MEQHLRARICCNSKCPAAASSSTSIWKQGWRLQSGRFADLCGYCGLVFEQSNFCETFHNEEAGWRTCNNCKKRLHCGCIVSACSLVQLDLGGVECVSCNRRPTSNKIPDASSDSTSLTRACSLTSEDNEQSMLVSTPNKKPRLIETPDKDAAKQSSHIQIQDDQKLPQQHVPGNESQQQQQHASRAKNSRMVPLFEKMLTASDAGRIGRLILPKASAEAFFPAISSPEGVPIKMNDMFGKEWQFQFRYWPNNSSRMYVLEGITACVKAMQLQAGDVVTFSRIEPGGKMVMGCRRSRSKSAKATPPKPAGLRSQRDPGASSRSIWEEAQELLTPPPGVIPSIMTIDGHKFEEYEEPPVLSRKLFGQQQFASPLAG